MYNLANYMALDTETSGLKETDLPFLTTYRLDGNTGLEDFRKDSISPELVKEYCSRLVLMQNAKFDMKMMWHKFGILPGEVLDLEVLARLVRNNHFKYSLDAIAKRHGLAKDDGVMAYIDKYKLKTKVTDQYKEEVQLHFDRVPDDVMYPYAKMDVELTEELVKRELALLDPRSEELLKLEMKLTPVCFKMERSGVRLDIDYTKNAMAHEESLLTNERRKFALHTGQPFDNTKKQLVDIFTKAGIELGKTEKGNVSLDDDALAVIEHPAAECVRNMRYLEKRISTYYASFMHRETRGLIHADMRQAGTATGRFSYREPNFQNMPKEEDSTEPYVVRGCIIPKRDLFLSVDYAQQEYRLMLAYANEQRLIKDVMAGADVHQATADLVKVSRKHAKTLNFAILYGAGDDQLAGMLKVTKREARELRLTYFGKLPHVEKFIQRVRTTARDRGFVYNWMGRKLNFDKGFDYAAPNHLIQGGGADVCKAAMVQLDGLFQDYSPGNYPMVLQVHDQLVFDLKESEAVEFAPKIKQIMENVFPETNGMRLAVDVTYSRESLADRGMKKWDNV